MIAEEIRNIKSDKSDLRKFGITMGIILTLLGGLSLWHEKGYFIYFFILAATFIIPGLVLPAALRPAHKGWMTLSILLGWVMTRVILSVLFYLVVTPTRCLARLFGKQFLDLKIDKNVSSYWIPKEKQKLNKTDYERQF